MPRITEDTMAQTLDTPVPKQVVAAGYDQGADAYTRLEDASWPQMRWLAKLLPFSHPTRQSWISAAAPATLPTLFWRSTTTLRA
jgi:hypothetical protein